MGSKKTNLDPLLESTIDLVRQGLSREAIADELGVSVWKARKLITQARTIQQCVPRIGLDPRDPLFRQELLRSIRKPVSPESVAELLSCTTEDVERTLRDLEECGYIIHRQGNTVSIGKSAEVGIDRIQLPNQYHDDVMRFGVVSDMHLGSKCERLDVLNAAYDKFAEEGVETVFIPGNYVDGEARFNRHELRVHGIADQCNYFLENMPQRDGIKTYYVDGDDHEGWWQQREGIEFGRYVQLEAKEQGRDDLVYLGYMEADVELAAPHGSCVIKIMHPGGGSSYALSYASQKITESLQGGEKPGVMLLGHYHKFDYCYPRNVHVVQCGCTQDQTRFMRKKKLEAHVGFVIIEMQQDINGGVSMFVPRFYPFYDRSYYIRRDDIGKRLKKAI